MKILGFTGLAPRTREATIGRSTDGKIVKVTLTAPPLGTKERVDQEIPLPTPPAGKALKDDAGNPILDAKGLVVTEKLTSDPGYLAQVEQVGEARGIATLVACLGDQVEFAAKRESFGTPRDFYLGLKEEFGQFGFDQGSWNELVGAALELQVLDPAEFEEPADALGDGKPGGNGHSSTGG